MNIARGRSLQRQLIAACLLTLSLVYALFLVCAGTAKVSAQSTSATINGQITDSQGKAETDTAIQAVNVDTNIVYPSKTNTSGFYAIPGLPPGRYRLVVRKDGFKEINKTDVTLNVQDILEQNFSLEVGSTSESVTVSGDSVNINTTDASVGTVIDRQFVENLPLNGRSFQSLLYITPGINPNAGAGSSSNYAQGQFVVNGQRSDANYWMVDGVAANIEAPLGRPGASVAGAVGGTNALGGTSALVSVDAMQEFRIETSTFAPEFGRSPGGQISIQTRSGTNQFHGNLFEYLRNTDLDSTDWFANHNHLHKAPEIQNDFGGVLGGPIVKDKTFFFFSAEALKLLLPATFIGTVPDLNSRATAIPAVQPYLNAYPKPTAQSQAVPSVPGVVTYNTTFSQPEAAYAYSLRVDHQLAKNLNLFARYNHAPSNTRQRGGINTSANGILSDNSVTKTATAGATWAKSSQIVNDTRFNYSVAGGTSFLSTDNYGGAGPLPAAALFPSPLTTKDGVTGILPLFGTQMYEVIGSLGRGYQHQFNVVDTVSIQRASHMLKFGIDYRRLSPSHGTGYFLEPLVFSMAQLAGGTSPETLVISGAPGTMVLTDLSLFGQDSWRVNSRLNLTYGARWDINFTPTAEQGLGLPALTGFSATDFSKLALGPVGAQAYATPYDGIAPRVGAAYRISTNPDWGLVLRGGFGVFYSLADTEISNYATQAAYYPFSRIEVLFGVPFPTRPADAAVPPITPPTIQNGETLFGFDPHLNLPYALEWNVALEQSLGRAQSVSVSYIGASDRRMLASQYIGKPNANYASAYLISNAGQSNYNALQAQFQRRLTEGLQALISYTWSHSIDDGSYGEYTNGSLANLNSNRGDSDFDIRTAFTAALTYNVPEMKKNLFTRAVTGGWSTDNIVQVRSGPPIDVQDGAFTALELSNASILIRPDIVPGQAKYLTGSQYPGHKAINPAYLTNPPVDTGTGLPTRQGNLGRNSFRALGLTQWDFAVHREFPIYEKVKLEFRAELFNLLNHPNFGPFASNYGVGNPYFGQSTVMLNQYLGGTAGSGTQNPLYTPGGPRSGEMALKLVF